MPATPRLLATLLLACAAAGASAAPPRVVATIPPVHALVAGVVGDRAEVTLLVPGGRSPHDFSLAPSDARALARADAVFAAGKVAERYLQRPLSSLAADARIVWMADLEGVRRLPARRGGAWTDAHGHGDEPGDAAHDRQEGSLDPHVWLDPRNAIALTKAAAEVLAELDAEHAGRYRTNADEQVRRLRALDSRLGEMLAPVAEVPYLVFHDAYQYFEARYGLAASGSVTVDPGRPPGARRVGELRERIERGSVRCLFTEPQFEPRIARVIAEGTDARIATLDPIGAGHPPGPGLYERLLLEMADAVKACLQGDGGPADPGA